jgi:hypothetical protein
MPEALPMYRWQYSTAAQYAKAALSLNESMNKAKSIDFVLPVVMCQLLAVELLLKSLILNGREDIKSEKDLKKCGIDIRGHNLKSLYSKLNQDTRSLVETHFIKSRSPRMSGMAFSHLLKEIGDQPFVEWRYFYEKGISMQLNRDALETLLQSVGNAANELIEKQ